MKQKIESSASEDFKSGLAGKQFGTILADPPWINVAKSLAYVNVRFLR